MLRGVLPLFLVVKHHIDIDRLYPFFNYEKYYFLIKIWINVYLTLKHGKVGQDVIKKYVDISCDNCVYNTITKRCAKTNSKVSPKVGPQAIRHIAHIASGVKLSDTLKHISSNNCDIMIYI